MGFNDTHQILRRNASIVRTLERFKQTLPARLGEFGTLHLGVFLIYNKYIVMYLLFIVKFFLEVCHGRFSIRICGHA